MNIRTRIWLRPQFRGNQRQLRLERLETRDVPSSTLPPLTGSAFQTASTILTSTHIVTPFDKIPNFAKTPTVTSNASGNWSNPAIWSTGVVPGANDVVSINPGQIVNYDVNSTTPVKTVAIQAGGSLRFRTDIDTRLTVVNLLVMEGGELQIGTSSNPVASNVKATVVFADVPLDLLIDPEQYGNGLIALGKVTVYGSPSSSTFVRLAAEPLAGATTLTLSQAVTGWNVGDRVALPDTRQLTHAQRWLQYTSQLETPTISAISGDGLTLTLSQPLQFNHKAARDPDGNTVYMPHVGHLTHNVAFRSQSNLGTRGHTFFTQRAEVDINFAAFQGLGRTINAADDNTTLDSAGVPTYIGKNQAGRYPVYFNHLLGAAGGTSSGYQFTFSDNSVVCMMNPQPFRWGLTLTDSSFGLIQDNVIYNWAGAGILTTSGTETSNVFAHNFVVGIKGDSNPRDNLGRDGVGFWTVGFSNYLRDNVVATAVGTHQGIVAGSGFNLFAPAATSANRRVPLFPGADTTVQGQYQLVDIGQKPVLEFVRNEAYGAMATGLTMWHLGTTGYGDKPVGQSIIKDFIAWHVFGEGFFGYPTHNVLFDGFTVFGDRTLSSQGETMGWTAGDYWASEITIRNANIQGMYRGIGGSLNTPIMFRIENSFFRNYRSNVEIETLATPGSRAIMPARTTIIDNVRYQSFPGAPTFSTLYMNYNDVRNGANFIQRDEVYVLNHNGVAGDNFQAYYPGQSPTHIVPPTTYYGPDANNDGIGDWIDSRGAPVAGLTNAAAWVTYGIAVAGSVAPSTVTRANVIGYVKPITTLAGVNIVPGTLPFVSEGGASDTYGVSLIGAPSGNVTVVLSPDSQLSVSPNQLVFTPQDWSVRQNAIVSAFNDAIVEANHSGKLSLTVSSGDPSYQGMTLSDRIISIHDNDTQLGLAIQPSTTSIAEGGTPASFGLSLISQPTANVTVRLTPDAQLSVNTSTFVFTPQNWSAKQFANVAATDDTLIENAHTGTLRFSLTSNDPLYQGLAVADRILSIQDNDFLYGVSVQPGASAVAEGGKAVAYSFALLRQPSANVTVQLLADAQISIGSTSLTFTTQNWSTGQTVNVTAVNDTAIEGVHSGKIRFTLTSADSKYQGLAVPDRAVPIQDNDISRVFATGSDAGGSPMVRIIDAATQVERFRFDAYSTGFRGGVRVATGDVNGDGYEDLVTGPGQSGGPHVRVFSGRDGNLVKEFYAFHPAFAGGLWLATGDINKDGYADMMIGAGPGGGPHVRVFSGRDNSVLTEFFAYTAAFRGGVRVAAGDVNGDGNEDIVLGAGPGGGPHIRVLSGANPQTVLANFFAYAPGFSAGVWVAAGDVDGDGKAEVIVTPGSGGGPHVVVFKPMTATIYSQTFAYAPSFTGGVRVGTADLNGDGKADLIIGAGAGLASSLQYRRADTFASMGGLSAYDPTFMGGVFVG